MATSFWSSVKKANEILDISALEKEFFATYDTPQRRGALTTIFDKPRATRTECESVMFSKYKKAYYKQYPQLKGSIDDSESGAFWARAMVLARKIVDVQAVGDKAEKQRLEQEAEQLRKEFWASIKK